MARKDKARDQAKPKKNAKRPPEPRRRQLRFSLGARRQEIAGVLLIMLAAVSLLALPGITTGVLIDWWSTLLKRVFGAGAYVAAMGLGIAGLAVFRRAQGLRLAVNRARLIGVELGWRRGTRQPRGPSRGP